MNTATRNNETESHFFTELLWLLTRIIISALTCSLLLSGVVLALTAISQAANAAEGIVMKPGDARQGTLLFRSEQGTVGVPTLDTNVSIHISGPLARARVVQTFDNASDQWQEGIYVFPLPENAAVDRLRIRIGERIIEGEIKEREEAKAIYEQARDNGQRAALLEQERPNLFTTNVANIGPKQRIIVEIEYQQTLSYEHINGQSRYSLRFPMVVGPRYIPGIPLASANKQSGRGWSPATDIVADAPRITPPVVHSGNGTINPVTLHISLDAGFPIATVNSTYHSVRIERNSDNMRTIELADGPVAADRDFELNWTLAGNTAPTAALFTETGSSSSYALLMLMPPVQNAQAPKIPREVIYVIDTSGSMYGESIVQAREALALALTRLRPEDRFNVIEFNSVTHALFNKATPAVPDNIKKALTWVRRLEANGGTEMFDALNLALDGRTHPGWVRQVIFLTDGSVGNETALFKLIGQKLGDSRLFTIGIGSAPNSYFMRKAAETGRGTFTYIGKTSEVKERMSELFTKLETPVLKGITVDWGTQADVSPQQIPDLYLGEPLIVSAALAQTPPLEQLTVTLSGDADSHGGKWQANIALRNASSGKGIGTLWARQKIGTLTDTLHDGANEEEVRTAVLKLALEHQLVSKYTSLVAIDKTPVRRPEQALNSSELPTNLPEGWDYASVFGELPQGASSARLHLLAGILALLACTAIGLPLLRTRRHEQTPC